MECIDLCPVICKKAVKTATISLGMFCRKKRRTPSSCPYWGFVFCVHLIGKYFLKLEICW